jgi:hypothetical protein
LFFVFYSTDEGSVQYWVELHFAEAGQYAVVRQQVGELHMEVERIHKEEGNRVEEDSLGHHKEEHRRVEDMKDEELRKGLEPHKEERHKVVQRKEPLQEADTEEEERRKEQELHKGEHHNHKEEQHCKTQEEHEDLLEPLRKVVLLWDEVPE